VVAVTTTITLPRSRRGRLLRLLPPLLALPIAVRSLRRDRYCPRCTLIASRRPLPSLYTRCVANDAERMYPHPVMPAVILAVRSLRRE
jgi:hypothetical protein